MKPILLMMTYSIIPPGYMEKFNVRFEVHYAPTPADWVEVAKQPWVKDVRAVFTMGSRGIKRELMDRMPNLEIACCKGAGYDGFEMPVGYHTRSPKRNEPFKHYPDLLALARDSDFLMCILPLNDQSRYMINAEVLDALGPQGYLFNMARGPVVENAALIPALQQGRIAGAGLDVVEGEPEIPAELIALKNVTMTPHVGSHVPESARETLDLLLANLDAHFAGQPVLTPIPGSTAGGAD